MDKKDVVYVNNGILLSFKMKEILPLATTWINVEDIMLSKISQIQNNKYPMISISCGILGKKKKAKYIIKKRSMVVTREWGRGNRGIVDQRIQTFREKIRKFWRPAV